ncbi:MAG: class I SAM-dependent methyltransferase [Burkholderiales bacterium]
MSAMHPPQTPSVSASLHALLHQTLQEQGGWLPFDQFMNLALYAPGLGYYARDTPKFGHLPQSGSDFVTAPELSPLFGKTLALQVRQALQACGSSEIIEFGAGSGALAGQLLDALGGMVDRYTLIELSAPLRQRQQSTLAPWAHKVRWLDTWPAVIHGVVVANEVLDAMPVQLLSFNGQVWAERGVVWHQGAWAWADVPTSLRPPVTMNTVPGTVTEIHPHAEAFITSLSQRLVKGAVFLIDYGFPEAEYYHPQRQGGTLMCHRAHQSDTNPLVDVGEKDITSHINFTGIALAAQDAGMDILGYTSQGNFLLNCGLLDHLNLAELPTLILAQKLITEHEMGELFKVLGLARGCHGELIESPIGFSRGDRSHTL